MSNQPTIAVAMSGGVDSSTAAALLVERGYNVIGLMMRLWSEPPPLTPPPFYGGGAGGEGDDRCCSPEAVADARGVCQKLGIPFYLLNMETEFKQSVVDLFLDGYARGVTPNPCIECNRRVKFGALLAKARTLSADFLATGHYARIRRVDDGYQLWRGIDARKDQSYALYALTQAQLARSMFPLGEFTKEQTREMARRYGLRIAEKIESQDLCFVPDGEYRNFLRRHIPHALRSGPIVDRAGHELARHEGLALYTIGQRKGLNVAVGEPLYVLELDAERNAVVVGKKSELGSRELVAREVNFISGRAPEGEIRVMAKIRYRATEVEATLTPSPSPGEGEGRTVRVVFDVPLRDITPGQSVVFYDGEVCLGGGIIERVTSDVGRVT